MHTVPRRCGPAQAFYTTLGSAFIRLLGGYLLVMLVISPILVSVYRKEALYRNGARTDAYIISSRSNRGKEWVRGSRPTYAIEYTYSIPGAQKGKIYHGEDSLPRAPGTDGWVQAGMIIPVIYDPSDPSRSMAAESYSLQEGATIRKIVASWVYVFVALVLMFFLIYFSQYRKQKRLFKWGQMASAKIVSMELRGVRIRAWSVTYTFRDSKGMEVKATKVLSEDDWFEMDISKYRPLTIIFLPEDSAKSAIYPFKFVKVM